MIPVNERSVQKYHVSCNMKSIMSRVAESTEEAVRKHLRGISLAQLARKVPSSLAQDGRSEEVLDFHRRRKHFRLGITRLIATWAERHYPPRLC